MGSDSRTHRLYSLLQQLEGARIHYTLARVRGDTVMVCATVPGRRYEIEVFADGTLEVEVFGGTGPLTGEEAVDALLANYSDGARV
ncbi:MAG TPA: hypothetical protein VNC82_10230 [Candidatus Limnocylindria bacterium]|nr:hypothetical protein [Candidatus Limnocylindria bacterium]